MASIVVSVSEKTADYWRQLAESVSLPVGSWLALCGVWGAALDLPMTRIILRQPPAADALAGVAWEVGEFPGLTCPPPTTQGEPRMVNKVILVGNLGKDPELRSTASGTAVASFPLATNRHWKDKDGNDHEDTAWHNVVCFGRQAEIAKQYLSRSRQLYLEGRIQYRTHEDETTGEARYWTEIVCERLQMLDHIGDAGT